MSETLGSGTENTAAGQDDRAAGQDNQAAGPAEVPVSTLRWTGGELYFLDQTRLPGEIVEEKQESVEQVWDAIKQLKVRGAPAIGVAGAYGILVGLGRLIEEKDLTVSRLLEELQKRADYLETSRPTAVNLSWAVRRMVSFARNLLQKRPDISVKGFYDALVTEAVRINEEDIELCRGIGENGKELIKGGSGVLTHCNAGALATSGIGTATAPMYMAHQAGVKFRVYADETRPLLQGARLTSWELRRSGLDVTLLTDNMAALVMSRKMIDLVIVGTDRVAANGDVANKIGTYGVAVLAKHFGIPFYVACPMSTVDLDTPTGDDIVIEERDPEEVLHFGKRRTGPEGMKVFNPAFDVTPHELVSGIITEAGIITAPYEENLQKRYGS